MRAPGPGHGGDRRAGATDGRDDARGPARRPVLFTPRGGHLGASAFNVPILCVELSESLAPDRALPPPRAVSCVLAVAALGGEIVLVTIDVPSAADG